MKIAVLLSGGVDSSVALRLLRENAGYNITAFYLKIWLEDELAYLGECPWEEDMAYAREVCAQIGVPLEVVPLQTEYWDRVVTHAISELKAGRTPSPDILCNQRIKFGAFVDSIDASFDKIASGHYARLRERDNQTQLLLAPDPVKDQTYFLSHLSQAQLARALFPIGEFTKNQVREKAQAFNLPNKDRKDSQGICFLGKIRYPEFVKYHLGDKPGNIVELETGKQLGEHNGYWYYTIGQRQGLGLGSGPWYVVGKDVSDNVIFVSHRENFRNQARSAFSLGGFNWISGMPASGRLSAKLRHGPERVPCTVSKEVDGRIDVELDQEDTGIAAGQYAVLYDDEVCLGGGVIQEAEIAVV